MSSLLRTRFFLSTLPRRSTTARSNSTVASTSTLVDEAGPPNSADTTHYRITLRRSAIGLPAHTARVVESLGLRKRLQSVYRPKRADIAGMVLAIKELVHVENVRRLDGGLEQAAQAMAEQLREAADETQANAVPPLVVRDEDAIWVNERNEVVDWGGKRARKAPRGFTVVGNVVNEARHRQILASKDEHQGE